MFLNARNYYLHSRWFCGWPWSLQYHTSVWASSSSTTSNNDLFKSIGLFFEERARTFQDAFDKLYSDQSEAEYVEYFKALQKLLANYHTTIRIPAADAALALATSATQASRCSRGGRAPPRGSCTGLGCWQSQSLRNKSLCLSSLHGFRQ